jgi:hypothetical protein
MAVITKKELNDWKKTFNLGDKVKVVGENEYKNQEGIITKKTSFVFVDLNGLVIGFRSGLEVIEPAVKIIKKREVYYNKYKVGDWIWTPNNLRSCFEITSEVCRIYRITDKSYWIEIPFLKNCQQGISSSRYAVSHYKNVNGKIDDTNYQSDENWTIPYECNKDDFEFLKIKNAFRASKPLKYDYEHITKKNKQGYAYSYVVR